MLLTEIFRTTIFRSAALASAAFGATTVALFALIYWQTESFETQRIDQFLLHESAAIAREPQADAAREVAARYAPDLHRQTVAGLFDHDARRIAGSIAAYPAGLSRDGAPHETQAFVTSDAGDSTDMLRAVASVLPDGRLLVVGRSEVETRNFRRIVLRAMALGVLPSLLAGLCVGVVASRRTLQRLQRVSESIARIVQGNLRERLETSDTKDAFGQLTAGVNAMLDEIERLMAEIRTAGDAMAHDLRTPLARVRARLEGARNRSLTHGELAEAVDAALADMESSFALITALLRIAQFDGSLREAGFAQLSLSAICHEAVELYEPIAEARAITLANAVPAGLAATGDRDLLFEAVANLLDNAIKFAPEGSTVGLAGGVDRAGPWLCITDHGPGIPAGERALLFRRFYRGEAAQGVPGHGLGLSLVAAILRLHRFHLVMADGHPGLVAKLCCWPEAGLAAGKEGSVLF